MSLKTGLGKVLIDGGTASKSGDISIAAASGSYNPGESSIVIGVNGDIDAEKGGVSLEAKNGDIVVAYIEGEGNTLKRYRKYGHTVFLHPENPKYRDIPLLNCKIQGIAINVIKKL